MIAYMIGGSSFGNCVGYVTRKMLEEDLWKQHKADEKKYEANGGDDIIDHLSKDWELIGHTEDVRIYEGRKAMAEDIARPTKQRKKIKSPVGHISLDFHKDDKTKLTDDLMGQIALDYMQQMGLVNTPFIVVRHFDKEHPHCHIVFSRVDYDGKILTQTTNFKKNERVCKALNKKYNFTQSKSKLNTDVSKLRGKEKIRYEITQDIAKCLALPHVIDWDTYNAELSKYGITTKEVMSQNGNLNLYYCKDGHKFWSKKLHENLNRQTLENYFLGKRIQQQESKSKSRTNAAQKESSPTPASPRPSVAQQPQPPKPKQRVSQWLYADGSIVPIISYKNVKLTEKQKADYVAGKSVRIDGCQGLFSTVYIKFNRDTGKFGAHLTNPDAPKKQVVEQPKATTEPTKPIVIPPLPKDYMGMRIAAHEYDHYEKGGVISGYRCDPGEIVGKRYWIWYDFQTGKPQCSTSMPAKDRYIPEAFTRQQAAHRAAVEQAQGGGIRNCGFGIGTSAPDDDGICMVHGTPTEDFKHFMEMHPGMNYEEAKHKFKEMLKGKQRSQGPKLGM